MLISGSVSAPFRTTSPTLAPTCIEETPSKRWLNEQMVTGAMTKTETTATFFIPSSSVALKYVFT